MDFSIELDSALSKLNFVSKVIKLRDEIYQNLLSSIITKFTIDDSYQYPLWENLLDKYSIKDEDSWKWIQFFQTNEETILLFEPSDERQGYVFQNKINLVDTLGECFGFVFYLTNLKCDYILCHNDHDYLIAVGTAKLWLEKLEIPNSNE